MSAGMVLLALAAVVVVLLVIHRSEGNLGRALVEYALVGVLAVLLAATPATAGLTAGVAAGVTSGSQQGAELAARAWRATFSRPAIAEPPATTTPTRTAKAKAKQRPKAAKQPTSRALSGRGWWSSRSR